MVTLSLVVIVATMLLVFSALVGLGFALIVVNHRVAGLSLLLIIALAWNFYAHQVLKFIR